jgi:hypothetical protein
MVRVRFEPTISVSERPKTLRDKCDREHQCHRHYRPHVGNRDGRWSPEIISLTLADVTASEPANTAVPGSTDAQDLRGLQNVQKRRIR